MASYLYGDRAPSDLQYIVLVASANLDAERVLTPGSGLSGTDGGAGSTYTLDLGALTANWDVGSYKIIALQFESDATTGTAPFIIASTTVVANLNADLLDGLHSTGILAMAVVSGGNVVTSGGEIVWQS